MCFPPERAGRGRAGKKIIFQQKKSFFFGKKKEKKKKTDEPRNATGLDIDRESPKDKRVL